MITVASQFEACLKSIDIKATFAVSYLGDKMSRIVFDN